MEVLEAGIVLTLILECTIPIEQLNPWLNTWSQSEVLNLLQIRLNTTYIVNPSRMTAIEVEEVQIEVHVDNDMLDSLLLDIGEDWGVQLECLLASFGVDEEDCWRGRVLAGFVSGTAVSWNKGDCWVGGVFLEWKKTIAFDCDDTAAGESEFPDLDAEFAGKAGEDGELGAGFI